MSLNNFEPAITVAQRALTQASHQLDPESVAILDRLRSLASGDIRRDQAVNDIIQSEIQSLAIAGWTGGISATDVFVRYQTLSDRIAALAALHLGTASAAGIASTPGGSIAPPDAYTQLVPHIQHILLDISNRITATTDVRENDVVRGAALRHVPVTLTPAEDTELTGLIKTATDKLPKDQAALKASVTEADTTPAQRIYKLERFIEILADNKIDVQDIRTAYDTKFKEKLKSLHELDTNMERLNNARMAYYRTTPTTIDRKNLNRLQATLDTIYSDTKTLDARLDDLIGRMRGDALPRPTLETEVRALLARPSMRKTLKGQKFTPASFESLFMRYFSGKVFDAEKHAYDETKARVFGTERGAFDREVTGWHDNVRATVLNPAIPDTTLANILVTNRAAFTPENDTMRAALRPRLLAAIRTAYPTFALAPAHAGRIIQLADTILDENRSLRDLHYGTIETDMIDTVRDRATKGLEKTGQGLQWFGKKTDTVIRKWTMSASRWAVETGVDIAYNIIAKSIGHAKGGLNRFNNFAWKQTGFFGFFLKAPLRASTVLTYPLEATLYGIREGVDITKNVVKAGDKAIKDVIKAQSGDTIKDAFDLVGHAIAWIPGKSGNWLT